MANATEVTAEEFGHGYALPGTGVNILQTVKPFIAVAAVIATGGVLVAAIYFTLLDLQWITFLGGVLFASILAMATQAARAEAAAASGAERLSLTRYQLAGETRRREALEALFAAANARLHYPDESLPVMIAFVDQNSHYQYHNRAFRNWLGLEQKKIDGQHMRDVLGRKVFAEVEAYIFEATAGRTVRYERTQKTPSGALYRLSVQYLPQFDADGKYSGFFKTITDITERRDVRLPVKPDGFAQIIPEQAGIARLPAFGAAAMPDESVDELEREWKYASQRILAAINGNEFTLFCQKIVPLSGNAPGPEHYEVLIRLLEEENSMVPPGAFFALAEEHGLLPQLDRWVFTHVLDWMAGPAGAGTVSAGAIYFINIATATISDPDFPEFVEYEFRRTGVRAGSVCVEIAEHDLAQHGGDAVAFARSMRQCGCLTAMSGFGRNQVQMEKLLLFPVDFLKIDGSIVRQILAYPAYLAKAVAISRIAKAIGVRTIAEMVEDEATLGLLRRLNVNFAQGLGISAPLLLTDMVQAVH